MLRSGCVAYVAAFFQHYTQALGAKPVEVWSPWKPDLEYRCVGRIVWRAAEAVDGADLKAADPPPEPMLPS